MKQAFSTQLALYLFMAAGFFLLSCLSKAPGQQLVLTDTISGPYQGRLYQLPDATINALKIWATQCDEPGFLSEVILRRNGVEQSPDCSEEEERPAVSTSLSLGDKKELKIYPNPASNVLHLEYPSTTGNGWLRIFDLQGSLQKQVMLPTSNKQVSISIGDISEGLYLIHWLCEGVSGYKKVVIVR